METRRCSVLDRRRKALNMMHIFPSYYKSWKIQTMPSGRYKRLHESLSLHLHLITSSDHSTESSDVIRPHSYAKHKKLCGLLLPVFRGLCVCVCVCWSQSPAHRKTTEPIETQFGLWTRVCTGNHVLDGAGSLHRKGTLWETSPSSL